MDLKEIDPQINIDHWYYQTKFLALKKLLTACGGWPPQNPEEKVIVEIGAGSGIFLRAFLASLKAAPKFSFALDLLYQPEALGVRERVNFVRELPEGVRPGYLFFIDILEHVVDDALFLRDWQELAEPGSYFVFSVPANKSLWSSHDIFLKHKRRYTLKELEKTVSGCGLKVIKGSYFFAAVFPLVFLMRAVLEPLAKYLKIYHYKPIKKTNFVMDLFLKSILSIELMLGLSNRFFGVSCFVVAMKP